MPLSPFRSFLIVLICILSNTSFSQSARSYEVRELNGDGVYDIFNLGDKVPGLMTYIKQATGGTRYFRVLDFRKGIDSIRGVEISAHDILTVFESSDDGYIALTTRSSGQLWSYLLDFDKDFNIRRKIRVYYNDYSNLTGVVKTNDKYFVTFEYGQWINSIYRFGVVFAAIDFEGKVLRCFREPIDDQGNWSVAATDSGGAILTSARDSSIVSTMQVVKLDKNCNTIWAKSFRITHQVDQKFAYLREFSAFEAKDGEIHVFASSFSYYYSPPATFFLRLNSSGEFLDGRMYSPSSKFSNTSLNSPSIMKDESGYLISGSYGSERFCFIQRIDSVGDIKEVVSMKNSSYRVTDFTTSPSEQNQPYMFNVKNTSSTPGFYMELYTFSPDLKNTCNKDTLGSKQFTIRPSHVVEWSEDVTILDSIHSELAPESFTIKYLPIMVTEVCAVGIDEKKGSENKLFVYPNPSNGEFTIDVPNTGTISIYNTTGQLVHQQNCTTGENEISLINNAAGIYTAIFTGEKKNFRSLIVLQ